MNKNDKKNNRSSSQKGIALLFSLAILALLLVMALGFATNAIFDQRTAYNCANVTSARILSQAELNKVLTLLKYYDDGIFYSHNTAPATSDMLDRLTTMEGGSYAFEWKSSYSTYINWNYIKVNDGTTDRIIGRTAFVLIPDEGIDPGTLVDSAVDEAANPYPEKRIGVNVNEINVRSIDPVNITDPIATLFNWTTQPTNPGIYGGSWVDFPSMFKNFKAAGQTLSNDMKNNFRQKWFVIDTMPDKEAFWIDLNGDNVVNKDTSAMTKFELFHRFYLPQTVAFWNGADIDKDILLDNNKDGVPDISLIKWASAGPVTTPGGIPWLAFFGMKDSGLPTVEIPAGSGLFYHPYVDDDATYKETYTSALARRRQIAANLVEYCKSPITGIASDTAISSLPSGTDWLTSAAPAYTGNKKTPYINELGGHVQADAKITENGGNYDITVTLKFRLYSEIINIYANAYPRLPPVAALVLRVNGSFIYDYDIGNSGVVPNNTATISNDVNVFSWSIAAGQGYGISVDPITTVTINQNGVPAAKAYAIVNNVKFKIDKAILYESGIPIFYDYAGISNTSNALALQNFAPGAALPAPTSSLSINDIQQNGWFSVETEDPRQNLNPEDWTAKSPIIDNVNLFAVWTAIENPAGVIRGAVNTNSNPAARHTALLGVVPPVYTDTETATDPANGNLSTAFIRNGSMLSPWELGFIHRGQRWQTINLKEYDKFKAAKAITVAGNTYCPGGGKYSDITNGGGDANILDQIKMTDQTTSPKKINIKTHRNEVLKALLNKVKIGCIPDPNSVPIMDLNSMAVTGGLAIDTSTTKADVLIGKIKEKNINFFTRAGIADVTEYALGSTDPAPLNVASRNTDATQEELIGKTVNLCEVAGQIEYFTVIVIAQAIRDVGAPSGAGTGIDVIKKSADGTKQFNFTAANGSRATKLGTFDYDSTTGLYADEIIGEQKIKVRGYRDASGNCQILSYEYVE